MRARQRLALPALLLLCCVLPGTAGHAAPDTGAEDAAPDRGSPADLEDLMRRFASSGGVRAGFRETKHLSLLREPLVSEGVLYFAPPDLLARHTTRPGRSSVVVRGDRVAFRDETGEQVIDLGASEIARQFVDNIGVLLRGDIKALRSRYDVDFRAEGETWRLHLAPRSRAMRHIVEWIRVEGRGAQLTEMETRETSGDTTATVFFEVETGHDFTPAERERFFSLEYRGGAS